ncbi:MAG: ArsR/SmtB family transcription factor [Nitrospirales bacterium]
MAQATIGNRKRAVRLFQALSDETRLRIIEQLEGGEQCVCDLTDCFKTGQSRLSFHLRVLKKAGLVQDRPDGRWVYYSINPAALEELTELVESLKESRAGIPSRPCCP